MSEPPHVDADPQDGELFKFPWQSRAVWGAVAVVVSQLAALAGWQVDVPALTEIALSLVGLIGGAVALWGRWQATRPIRLRRPPAQ